MIALNEDIVYTLPAVDFSDLSVLAVNSTKYSKYVTELDFAISAGDKEFAPAVRLVLREAMVLAHNPHRYTPESYQSAINAIKSAYASLLEMPTKHPIATQLKARFKRRYTEDFWDFLEQSSEETNTRSWDIVANESNITKNAYFIAKQLFDTASAMVILILLLPLLLLTMLLIKIDSPGPVFFSQKRVGARRIHRAGMTVWEPVEFNFHKFRSMYYDADESIHKEYIENWIKGELETEDAKNGDFKLKNDPRITRIGHFIRKTSIDELPQLFNVIKGDMSLVGPRPVPVYEVESYKKEHYQRLASVPGITGHWQIHGRGRTTLDEQVQMDIDYIHQQSLWQDIRILLSTPAAIVKGKGAR